ncbi:MAG: CRTAC1 family protein [Opitutae bacterium]
MKLRRLLPGFPCRRTLRPGVWPGVLLLGWFALARLEAAPPSTPEICAPGTSPAGAGPVQPESTRKMVARLRAAALTGDLFSNPFRFPERVQVLRDRLAATTDPAQLRATKLQLAQELLNNGESEKALHQFEDYERLLTENHRPLTSAQTVMLLTAKAVCALRWGEQENCLVNHNADSCLFPLAGGGVHQLPRGSRAAVGYLTELLSQFPGDLRARWLLNIAAMTLGEYPAGVPPAWRMDPQLFASEYDIKHFPDVAGDLGLDVDDLAGGVVLDDFNSDGRLDLMVSAQDTSSQIRFFINNGEGTFSDHTVAAGLTGLTGGLNLVHADYNNDGFIDVLVLRGGWLSSSMQHPASLLRNNGNGTFTDVTEEAGLLRYAPTQTATWFDFNGDGWLDLFMGSETQGQDINPCQLFRNNGDGTFTECAAACGVAVVGFVKSVVSGDYNNDGRPDLYLSLQNKSNLLLRNDGPAGGGVSPTAPWKFTNVAAAAGVTEPFSSFSCWFFDYDNDGWLDLFVAGYHIQDVGDVAADYLGLPHAGERARLYHNRGDGTFEDVSKQAGLDKLLHTMGCNFGDLDNDGWLDFYVGTGDPNLATLIPNRMFRNDGARRFQDVTTAGGFGQLQKGHAIAFGDIDEDGDQDIYSVVGGAISSDHYHNQLFANPGHGNHWLKLKLEGVQSNRGALGARLKLVLKTANGERVIHRSVTAGSSFGGNPFRVEFGLGQALAVVRAEIFWPVTGQTQILTGLEIDHSYAVREGAAAATRLTPVTFQLPTSPAASHRPHVHGSGPAVPGNPIPQKP